MLHFDRTFFRILRVIHWVFFIFGFSGPVLVQAGPPAMDLKIWFKTKTETFNHFNNYVLMGENEIWFRPRSESWEFSHVVPAWQRIPLPRDLKSISSIQADGTKLMALSASAHFLYSKTVGIERRDARGQYQVEDISAANNWKKAWLSNPFLRRLPGLKGPLEPPDALAEGSQTWGVSHRGLFNHYYAHSPTERSYVTSKRNSVTSVFFLANGAVQIANTRLPWRFRTHRRYPTIRWPENFIGEAISTSASLVLISGHTTTGYKALYFMFVDSVFKKHVPPAWLPVPLPNLYGMGTLTEKITVLQNGVGNAAREIRVEGTRGSVEGYYFKRSLLDTIWQFHPYTIPPPPPPPELPGPAREEPTVDSARAPNLPTAAFFDPSHGIPPPQPPPPLPPPWTEPPYPVREFMPGFSGREGQSESSWIP